MRPVLPLLLLTACDITLSPQPYITGIAPSLWDVGDPEELLTVTGKNFVPDSHVNLEHGSDPALLDEFTGMVGGKPLRDVIWVDNDTLMIQMPEALDPGIYELTITTPLDMTARLADAVRVTGYVADMPKLIVNTTIDEDELPSGETALLENTGANLSLREALLVANVQETGPYVIRFDPTVFPEDSPGVIEVQADPTPDVMVIQKDGTVLDGFGAGVEISGVNQPRGHLLTVEASNVLIRGITFRNFIPAIDTSQDPPVAIPPVPYCLFVNGSERVRIKNNVFSDCDDFADGGGAQVVFNQGVGHELIGNILQSGGRDGALFRDPTERGIIRGNTSEKNGDDGLSIDGTGHVIVDNVIHNNRGNGIESNHFNDDITVFRNSFVNNGDGEYGSTTSQEGGIYANGPLSDYRIIENEFRGNHDGGVLVARKVIGGTDPVQYHDTVATIRRCRFVSNGDGSGGYQIRKMNTEVPLPDPPTITSVDGSVVMGTSAVGVVEIYAFTAVENRYDSIAWTQTDGNGNWELLLPSSPSAVVATVTTSHSLDKGSWTSDMSPPFFLSL